MQEFKLSSKTIEASIYQSVSSLCVSVVNYSDHTQDGTYYLDKTDKHYNKLASYKSVSALVKYVKANQLGDTPQLSPSLQKVEPHADTCPPYHQPISEDEGVIFCDVETTGLSDYDEIIEIAIIDINENILYQSLIKPDKKISDKITKITGITNKMLNNAPKFLQVFEDLHKIMNGKEIIFYNADFDTKMIKQTANRYFKQYDYRRVCSFQELFNDRPKVRCLMIEYADFWKQNSIFFGYKWQTLSNACRQQQIQTSDIKPHRAVGDAVLTARLYRRRLNWQSNQRLSKVVS